MAEESNLRAIGGLPGDQRRRMAFRAAARALPCLTLSGLDTLPSADRNGFRSIARCLVEAHSALTTGLGNAGLLRAVENCRTAISGESSPFVLEAGTAVVAAAFCIAFRGSDSLEAAGQALRSARVAAFEFAQLLARVGRKGGLAHDSVVAADLAALNGAGFKSLWPQQTLEGRTCDAGDEIFPLASGMRALWSLAREERREADTDLLRLLDWYDGLLSGAPPRSGRLPAD